MSRYSRNKDTLAIVLPTPARGRGGRGGASESTAVTTFKCNARFANTRSRADAIATYGLSEADDIVIANGANNSLVVQRNEFDWNGKTYRVVGVRRMRGRGGSAYETMNVIGAQKKA